jgi:hypothetical protein
VRAVHFRGSALAAAGAAPALIAREATRLEEEPATWAQALGTLLRATVHSRAGEFDLARDVLERAVRELDAADLALYAACARRRLGSLVGGDVGAALIEEADRWFVEQHVRNPERMTAMLAPA